MDNMEQQSNANQPAFPEPFADIYREAENGYVRAGGAPGLTKREYAAIEAMEGFLSHGVAMYPGDDPGKVRIDFDELRLISFNAADAMLKEKPDGS